MAKPKLLDVSYFAKGEGAVTFLPGDFILTHGSGIYSELIRFGQCFRFTGPDVKYAYWSHAALITSASGDIVEALSNGVFRRNLIVYNEKEYVLVRIEVSDDDRRQAVAYAESAIGTRYGWATIVSIALSLISGLRFSFGFDESKICSGLVAGALERTNAIFPRPATHIMPADLAKYYDVRPADTYILREQKEELASVPAT